MPHHATFLPEPFVYFPMDEFNGNVVPSSGPDVTLVGADIIQDGMIGGAFRVLAGPGGHATGGSKCNQHINTSI